MIAQASAAFLTAGAGFTSDPAAVPGMDKFQTIISWTAWIAAGLCLIGLIVCGATLAISYHRGGQEHIGRLGGVAAGCLVVGAASSIVGALV